MRVREDEKFVSGGKSEFWTFNDTVDDSLMQKVFFLAAEQLA